MSTAEIGGVTPHSQERQEQPLTPKEFAYEFGKLTGFPLSERWVQLACARGRIQTVFGSFGRHLIPRSELERLAAELIGTAQTGGGR